MGSTRPRRAGRSARRGVHDWLVATAPDVPRADLPKSFLGGKVRLRWVRWAVHASLFLVPALALALVVDLSNQNPADNSGVVAPSPTQAVAAAAVHRWMQRPSLPHSRWSAAHLGRRDTFAAAERSARLDQRARRHGVAHVHCVGFHRAAVQGVRCHRHHRCPGDLRRLRTGAGPCCPGRDRRHRPAMADAHPDHADRRREDRDQRLGRRLHLRRPAQPAAGHRRPGHQPLLHAVDRGEVHQCRRLPGRGGLGRHEAESGRRPATGDGGAGRRRHVLAEARRDDPPRKPERLAGLPRIVRCAAGAHQHRLSRRGRLGCGRLR